MMDQSSGHGHMRKGVLNAKNMGVRFGERQGRLRKTKIRDVGISPGRCLSIGDE